VALLGWESDVDIEDMDVPQLRGQLISLQLGMRALMGKADSEFRPMTVEEASLWDRLSEAYEKIRARILLLELPVPPDRLN
jgi:hypothetical protein